MQICNRARAAALALALAVPGLARASAYSDFAFGRLAFTQNDLPQAARRFEAALAADPANAMLRARAFQAALVAGEARRAAVLAAGLPTGAGEDGTPAFLRLANAFAAADWAAADKAANAVAALKIGQAPATIARAWARFARGDREGALKSLDPVTAPAGASALVGEQRARMLAAMGRWSEARAAYAGVGGSGADVLIAAANAAARAGDAAGARAMLDGNATSGAIELARARLDAGRPILREVDGPREGLASMLGAVAEGFARGGANQPALAYARIATFAAPASAERRLLLAELLRQADQPRAAEKALEGIGKDSLFVGEARGLRARLLIDEGRRAEALAMLRRAAQARDARAYDWSLLGEIEIDAKDYAAAAQAFDHAVAMAEPGQRSNWRFLFQRGSAYEQAGNWMRAEPDLRGALALAPSQPVVLNYLGYALIDRGLKLDEGTRLLRSALSASPDSAAIQDSLGWAYFRQARYPDAVGLLERAVGGDPGDPTILEHLGDAYWAAGRRLEARYQWNAAASLDPEPDLKARLAAKIDYGFDAAHLAKARPAA